MALPLPDAKWLDFLQSKLPTFLGLAGGGGAILYLNREGLLPEALPTWIALIIAVVALISGFLAAASLLDALWKAIVWLVQPLYKAHLYRKLAKKKKRDFASYIPHLSEKERMIFAHLLHQIQKTFEGTPDCGYASLLYSLGYVQMIGQHRGSFDYYSVPFGVPDPVWEVLVERKDEFPYRMAAAARGRTVELSPWRKPVV